MKRMKFQKRAMRPSLLEPRNVPDVVDDVDVAVRDAKRAFEKTVIRKNLSKASRSTPLLIPTMGLATQNQAKRLTSPRLTKWKGNAKLAVRVVVVVASAVARMNP